MIAFEALTLDYAALGSGVTLLGVIGLEPLFKAGFKVGGGDTNKNSLVMPKLISSLRNAWTPIEFQICPRDKI